MISQKEKYIRILNSIDFHKIKDHPNILIAANFWDEERLCAAKICYKLMREIDDLIDNHKASNRTIAFDKKQEFTADVNEWLRTITVSDECNPSQKDLIETIKKFKIPLWPLEAFARSMIYDINNDGFATLDSFLDYAQGASVAPASIFVHLSGLTKHDGIYKTPPFDVKEAATPCAIFSYIIHIIRDFQEDQLNNMHYFADDLLMKNGLTRQVLADIARGSPVTVGFRNLIKEYYSVANEYRHKTYDVIRRIRPFVGPVYQLGLELIFNLYLMVFERIDFRNGKFTTEELNPTPEETRKRIYETIMNFTPA